MKLFILILGSFFVLMIIAFFTLFLVYKWTYLSEHNKGEVDIWGDDTEADYEHEK